MVRNRFNVFPMVQLSWQHLRNSPRAWLFALPTKIVITDYGHFYGEVKKGPAIFVWLILVGINTNPVVVRVWDSPNGNPGNLHPTRTSRWDFLLAFSIVYWPSDGQRLSSWLVNHSLWFRLIRPAMKPSFLGGGTSRGVRLTRHEFQADLTQTMDYDKFMNRWITRRHGVTTEIPTFQKVLVEFRCGKKTARGQQFTHIFFWGGGDEIWINLMQMFTGKFGEIPKSGSLFG